MTAAPHGDIFSRLGTGQVAEVLTADRVDRAEHDDALVGAPLEHRFEPGREREHALAGAGAAAEADDADLLVEQDVDGDVLLGRTTAEVEHGLVGAHEVQVLVGVHTRQRGLRSRVQRDSRVARQLARVVEVDDLLLVELVDHRAPDVELDEAGPAGVGGELVAVLVGLEPDDPGLQAQRQVLGDDDDLAALAAEAAGDREDAVVVGVGGERLRQGVELLVVELDPQRAALVVHRHRLDQRAVPGAEVLEEPERPAGRPAQLGVVALALELGEHHEREHDLVFREPRDRQRIGQEYRGVDDVDGRGDQGTGDASPRRGTDRGHWRRRSFTPLERAAHTTLRSVV